MLVILIDPQHFGIAQFPIYPKLGIKLGIKSRQMSKRWRQNSSRGAARCAPTLQTVDGEPLGSESRFLLEQHLKHHAPDTKLIAVAQHPHFLRVQLLPVDERAVGAVHVGDADGVVFGVVLNGDVQP